MAFELSLWLSRLYMLCVAGQATTQSVNEFLADTIKLMRSIEQSVDGIYHPKFITEYPSRMHYNHLLRTFSLLITIPWIDDGNKKLWFNYQLMRCFARSLSIMCCLTEWPIYTYTYIYIALFDVCVHAALQIYSYTRYQQDRELFRSNWPIACCMVESFIESPKCIMHSR